MDEKYMIDLIQRGPGGLIKIIVGDDAGGETPSDAFAAGQKAFNSRSADSLANGFRVMERASGKIVATWVSDGRG